MRISADFGTPARWMAAAATFVLIVARYDTSSAVPSQPSGGKTTFAWVGTYDLVASGFPDGLREAVMTIEHRDSTYQLTALVGPPGNLVSFKVTGDSAHVFWNLGTDQMAVDLRGSGDSLTGVWATPEWGGELRGLRRRPGE